MKNTFFPPQHFSNGAGRALSSRVGTHLVPRVCTCCPLLMGRVWRYPTGLVCSIPELSSPLRQNILTVFPICLVCGKEVRHFSRSVVSDSLRAHGLHRVHGETHRPAENPGNRDTSRRLKTYGVRRQGWSPLHRVLRGAWGEWDWWVHSLHPDDVYLLGCGIIAVKEQEE